MRRVHVRSLEIVRIAHVYFKNIRDMYTQKLFGFLDNGCFGEGNISYLPFEIYSSYSHSSLVMTTRNPAFPRDSIPCFPISLTLSFRGTLATLTFFFFWRVILLDVANLWCFTTWSLDLLTRRSTYSPAFFWRCGAKNVVFLSPLLSLLSPFLQPAGSCFLFGQNFRFVLGGLSRCFNCSIPLARFASYHHTRETLKRALFVHTSLSMILSLSLSLQSK